MAEEDPRTQQRMLMLDALRGIAALAVVLLHVSGSPSIFDRGYLAVDFFYVLSGFVLTAVFERPGTSDGAILLLRRIARLWPMMAAGTLLSIVISIISGQPVTLTVVACGLLFLPIFLPGHPVFPLNDPQWSLLAELLANVAHVVALRRLPVRWLALIAIAAWCALNVVASIYGELTQGPFGETWAIGLLRIAFGYTAGVILARTRQSWWHGFGARLPWCVAPLALLLALFGPAFVGVPARLADPFVVLAFVPVVAAGARAQPPGALCRGAAQIGQLSFPLYALHLPLIHLARSAKSFGFSGPSGGPLFVAVLAAITLAHIAGKSWLAKGLKTNGLEQWMAHRHASRAARPGPLNQRT